MTDNGSRYAEEFEALGDPSDAPRKIDVVLSTKDERYIRIGEWPDGEPKYALASDVARGPKYAERYAWTREEIERDDESPLVAEWSVEA